MPEVMITLEVGSCYPETDKYLGMLKYLGLDQQQYTLIQQIPLLVELKAKADREWVLANPEHYD